MIEVLLSDSMLIDAEGNWAPDAEERVAVRVRPLRGRFLDDGRIWMDAVAPASGLVLRNAVLSFAVVVEAEDPVDFSRRPERFKRWTVGVGDGFDLSLTSNHVDKADTLTLSPQVELVPPVHWLDAFATVEPVADIPMYDDGSGPKPLRFRKPIPWGKSE